MYIAQYCNVVAATWFFMNTHSFVLKWLFQTLEHKYGKAEVVTKGNTS